MTSMLQLKKLDAEVKSLRRRGLSNSDIKRHITKQYPGMYRPYLEYRNFLRKKDLMPILVQLCGPMGRVMP